MNTQRPSNSSPLATALPSRAAGQRALLSSHCGDRSSFLNTAPTRRRYSRAALFRSGGPAADRLYVGGRRKGGSSGEMRDGSGGVFVFVSGTWRAPPPLPRSRASTPRPAPLPPCAACGKSTPCGGEEGGSLVGRVARGCGSYRCSSAVPRMTSNTPSCSLSPSSSALS